MSPTTTPERSAILAAAREFNGGRYFEAHEALEEALEELPDELWELFLGLIQVAVGYHKATQELWSGAERMLRIGLEKLEPLPDRFGGVALGDLRARAAADQAALARGRFDRERFRTDPPRFRPLPVSQR